MAAPHAGPIAIGAAAQSLKDAVTLHADTRFVQVRVENEDIRLTINGTTPTASLGSKYIADMSVTLSRAAADSCKLIRAGSADAVIQVIQFTN
jgi:hypothetical protein